MGSLGWVCQYGSVSDLPGVAGDAQGLVVSGVDLLYKAAGVEAHDTVAFLVEQGVAEVEFITGPGDGDVEESALFFHIPFVYGALDGEESISQTDDKDDGEFETF